MAKYKDAKNKPTNVRFTFQGKKDISVFDRKSQRSVAGMFQVTKDKAWYVYSFPRAGSKPLLLNPFSPESNKASAMKKLKAFLKRKYK